MKRYTKIDDGVGGVIWTCDDCGEYASTPEKIKHHPTCKPGESKRWAEYYDKAGT
jgi:hypothetical protein